MICPTCGQNVPSLSSCVDGKVMCAGCLEKHQAALVMLAKGTRE